MPTAQLGGPIGPLHDPATGQQLQASLQGTFSYQVAGDPNAALPQIQGALLAAAGRVIQAKLSQNQVAIPTLAQSLPYFIQEIIAESGVQSFGAQVGELQLQAQVAQPTPAIAPYTGPMPPDPHTQMQNRMEQMAKDRLDPRNYEVKAKINIGGFRINASSKDGIDEKGLQNQVKEKVKSEIIWWGIGCFVLFIVVVGLAGLAFYIWRNVDASASGKPNKAKSEDAEETKWDGKSGFTCGGSDNVHIKGTKAKLEGDTAITAQGNCRIELEDVDITAKVGIQAGSNAVVVVKGGKVSGSEAAASALGNSKVTFDGTKVTGKKKALGNAKIEGP